MRFWLHNEYLNSCYWNFWFQSMKIRTILLSVTCYTSYELGTVWYMLYINLLLGYALMYIVHFINELGTFFSELLGIQLKHGVFSSWEWSYNWWWADLLFEKIPTAYCKKKKKKKNHSLWLKHSTCASEKKFNS